MRLLSFRKEVIARKRLERAQDRDGLDIDMRDVAQMMRVFSEEREARFESTVSEFLGF